MSNRFDYVKYDSDSADTQASFKQVFQLLEKMTDETLHNGRAKALVHTKLEEAYMWVGKSIRDSQIERNDGKVELQEERNAE